MEPSSPIDLSNLGKLAEGTLIKEGDLYFIIDLNGVRHALSDQLDVYLNRHVRVAVADLQLLSGLEDQLRDMAVGFTGMTNEQLQARLRNNKK